MKRLKMILLPHNSNEWYEMRRGKVTASQVSRILPMGSGRESYMRELLQESISSNNGSDGYQSYDMRRGHELEPFARDEYELETMNKVIIDHVSFHEDIEGFMVSPDGYVNQDGLIEIKSFKGKNFSDHLDAYLDGKLNGFLEKKYIAQVQSQLSASRRKWCDCIIYNPDFAVSGNDYIQTRAYRDTDLIDEIDSKVYAFLEEYKERLPKYLKRS